MKIINTFIIAKRYERFIKLIIIQLFTKYNRKVENIMNRFQNENHDGRWRPPQLFAAALSAIMMVLLMR
jgi:hypothetical protein